MEVGWETRDVTCKLASSGFSLGSKPPSMVVYMLHAFHML